ncbi:MAG: mechanosensitive ion channel [Fusobacteriaceae bacterium]|nr:mechanosensitive ion channel [Fusobacteriaceae bacterium]MBN2837239.1 mechanosensitive ion channel [Fusobacteriaceae bacterium]
MFYEIFEKIGEKGIELLLKGLMAIGIWIVGSYLIKTSKKIVFKKLDKQGMDPSLKSFFDSLGTAILYVMLVIITISTVGVQTSSLVAILGAAGLAIGLALQGSLSNFAGGVLIIIFRPFNVGDFIESGSVSGTVKEIQIFQTILDTVDNKRVIVPNAQLSNNSIINYTKTPTRRLDIIFGVGYNSDIELVKNILEKIVAEHKSVLKDPVPVIRLDNLGSSSLNFILRVHTLNENYLDLKFDITEQAKVEFDKNKIEIPFPKMDLNVKNL